MRDAQSDRSCGFGNGEGERSFGLERIAEGGGGRSESSGEEKPCSNSRLSSTH
jgi:hypothetical protein